MLFMYVLKAVVLCVPQNIFLRLQCVLFTVVEPPLYP